MLPVFDTLAQALLTGVASFATLAAFYYLALAVAYFAIRKRDYPPPLGYACFAIVIPAHNEELVLPAALDSWAAVEYPSDRFTIHVIADNCSDETAAIGRAHGVQCLERTDGSSLGKGQALAWALARISLKKYDAVVFVDADCTVSRSFLGAMNARLAAGAKVIQGFDGVLNPDESMLTRLMQITNVMKNRLFMHAKNKLGLSVQLMGTGMCFECSILERIHWTAFSIGEDLEQSAYLVDAGVRVEYEPAAIVYAHEAISFRQAYSQRIRWASSRIGLFRRGIQFLARGIVTRSIETLDAGFSLVVPNYALLANVTIVGIALAFLLHSPAYLQRWFLAILGALLSYLVIGLAISGLTRRSLVSLSLAPIFLAWKIFVDLAALLTIGNLHWTRTARSSRDT